MTPAPNERASRTLELAKALLRATEAMEDSNWQACQTHCQEAARLARVLILVERQEAEQE